jgi:hypothetical protein
VQRGHLLQLIQARHNRVGNLGKRPARSSRRRTKGNAYSRLSGAVELPPAIRPLAEAAPDAIYLATEGPLGWSALHWRKAWAFGHRWLSLTQRYADHYGVSFLQRSPDHLRWFTQLTLTACPTQQKS